MYLRLRGCFKQSIGESGEPRVSIITRSQNGGAARPHPACVIGVAEVRDTRLRPRLRLNSAPEAPRFSRAPKKRPGRHRRGRPAAGAALNPPTSRYESTTIDAALTFWPPTGAPAFLARQTSPGPRRIRAHGGSFDADRNCARHRKRCATRCGDLRRRGIRVQCLRGASQALRASIT